MAISLASLKTSSTLRPPRILMHGVHGVGKTTFAAGADAPVVIMTEDGLGMLKVPHFPLATSYADVVEALDALLNEEHAYRTESNLRSNLYVVGIADSGSGKNHSREIINEVLFEAGLANHLGGNKIASGAGLLTALHRQPAILFQIDEFGMFLSAAADRKRSPRHITEILDNMTELYTSAGGIFLGAEYANRDGTNERRDIVQPCLCVAEDRPAQVPLGLISSLMRRCDPAGKLLPPRFLHGGDVVRVTNGPFADFIGTVEQIAPDQRIWVLLDILGKNTRVAIRSADLRLAG